LFILQLLAARQLSSEPRLDDVHSCAPKQRREVGSAGYVVSNGA
jgi:hypothetical protein